MQSLLGAQHWKFGNDQRTTSLKVQPFCLRRLLTPVANRGNVTKNTFSNLLSSKLSQNPGCAVPLEILIIKGIRACNTELLRDNQLVIAGNRMLDKVDSWNVQQGCFYTLWSRIFFALHFVCSPTDSSENLGEFQSLLVIGANSFIYFVYKQLCELFL